MVANTSPVSLASKGCSLVSLHDLHEFAAKTLSASAYSTDVDVLEQAL